MSKPRKVIIAGIPVTVVSQAQAEKAEFIVCVEWTDPLLYPDNQRGSCGDCKKAVQFRPTAPRKPVRICLECMMDRGKAKGAVH